LGLRAALLLWVCCEELRSQKGFTFIVLSGFSMSFGGRPRNRPGELGRLALLPAVPGLE
jgi:hypothetical protein